MEEGGVLSLAKDDGIEIIIKYMIDHIVDHHNKYINLCEETK